MLHMLTDLHLSRISVNALIKITTLRLGTCQKMLATVQCT